MTSLQTIEVMLNIEFATITNNTLHLFTDVCVDYQPHFAFSKTFLKECRVENVAKQYLQVNNSITLLCSFSTQLKSNWTHSNPTIWRCKRSSHYESFHITNTSTKIRYNAAVQTLMPDGIGISDCCLTTGVVNDLCRYFKNYYILIDIIHAC